MKHIRHKKSSVYNELIQIFCIIILPFILFSIIFLSGRNHEQREEAVSAAALDTHNTLQNFNDSIYDIYLANFSLLGQSNVLKLSNRHEQLEPYERITSVKTLREQLTGMATSNLLIRNIRVHFGNWDRVYNSSGYPGGSFQTFDSQTYTDLLSDAQHSGHHTDGNNFSILITDPLVNAPSSIIEIVLSVDNIHQIFQNLCSQDKDYYLFLTEDGSFYIKNLPDDFIGAVLPLLTGLTESGSQTVINGNKYIVFYEEIPALSSRFLRVVSIHSLLGSYEQLTFYTIIFYILIFAGCLAFFFMVKRLIHQPLSLLINGFMSVEKGIYSVRIPDTSRNDFSYLYDGFNHMTENIERSIERDYKYRLLLQQAELKQLQTQINPHFLYNSFFMLQRTIKGELWEEAEEISRLLGNYFKYITRNAQDLVPLQDEYEHARIYAQIQGLRFESRLSIQFDELPPSSLELMVPKLILQPVLENSFQYGLCDKLSGGMLHIHFTETEKLLTIFLDDNGNLTDDMLASIRQRLELAQSGNNIEMTGILNISRRLTLFSHGEGCLTADRSSIGGLSICIKLPKKGETNYEPLINR